MKILTKVLTGVTAAASIVALAGSASAAIYVNNWSLAPNGEITVTFGNTAIGGADSSGVSGDAGTLVNHNFTSPNLFTDTFDFFLPTGYVTNATVSTANLTFTGISFNSVVGTVFNMSGFHTGSVGSVAISSGGPQQLVVTGSGVASAGWSGTASFVPVPEPATWGLMLMGFGGLGALLRRNRRALAFA